MFGCWGIRQQASELSVGPGHEREGHVDNADLHLVEGNRDDPLGDTWQITSGAAERRADSKRAKNEEAPDGPEERHYVDLRLGSRIKFKCPDSHL